MRVLIVEENCSRGEIWKGFLQRRGAVVDLVPSTSEAMAELGNNEFDALVLNIAMEDNAVLAVCDLASYRNPDIAILAVTSGTFFSDGSIFKLIPNACGCVGSNVPPKDLVDIVSHYANRRHVHDGGGLSNRLLG